MSLLLGIADIEGRGGAGQLRSPIDGPVSRGDSISSQSMCCVHVPRTTLPATRSPADSNRIRFLAPLAANRIAPVTHQVQACRDVLRPPWRHGPPQRNVGAKPCPRGWSFVWLSRWRRQSATGSRFGRFSHLLLHRVAQRRRPIIRWVLLQTGVWLTVFGQAITRNSAAHRRASARAACGSTPARVCERSP